MLLHKNLSLTFPSKHFLLAQSTTYDSFRQAKIDNKNLTRIMASSLQLATTVVQTAGVDVGAYVGSHFAFMLPGAVLRKIFAGFIILVGMRMFFE